MAELMQEGVLVFSPICHSHYVAAAHDLPSGYEYWKALDESFMDWADILVVVRIQGWQESVGVAAEVAYAVEHGMPVIYWDTNVKADQLRLEGLDGQ